MTEDEVGGFPSLASGPACVDRDSDGLPDEFEARFGLDADDATDGSLDSDGDGYSNVEEYLNGTTPL